MEVPSEIHFSDDVFATINVTNVYVWYFWVKLFF